MTSPASGPIIVKPRMRLVCASRSAFMQEVWVSDLVPLVPGRVAPGEQSPGATRPGTDANESSRCDGPQADALSLESSERTLRRLAASAITRKLGRSDGAAHFGLVPLGPFWLTGTFASILSGWRVGIEAVRPDFACMRLIVDRNPPAGVCPANPGSNW